MDETEGAGKNYSISQISSLDFETNSGQEIRNVTWISECIAQNQKERIGNFISVF